MTIAKQINAAPLTPELMKRLMTLVGDMPAEQRSDLTGRSIGIIRFLEEEYPGQETFERASLITAFQFRMEALMNLRTRPEYRAWTLQLSAHKEEPDVIHQVLVEAAATEPLIQRKKRPAFDPVSFFKRALAMSEAEGRA